MTLTFEEHVFLIVVILNTIIAVLYLLIGSLIMVPIRNRKREGEAERLHDNRRTYLLRFIVMLLCPVVGPLFFFVVHFFYLTIFRFQVELDDVVFSKERVRTQLRADEEREMNVIPLEEAVAVNDQKSLRAAMLNVLKGEIRNSLSAISLALETKDSESSHYAASILSHELSEFRMEVQKLYLGIREEAQEQTEYEDMMLGYTDNVLKQKVFTELEQRRFVQMMAEAAESFYMEGALFYHYFYNDVSMVHKYDSKMYEGIKTLYRTIKEIYKAKGRVSGAGQADREYIYLLLLALKNEIRGGEKGYGNRVKSICQETENREVIGSNRVSVLDKGNRLLYFVLRHPWGWAIAGVRMGFLVKK